MNSSVSKVLLAIIITSFWIVACEEAKKILPDSCSNGIKDFDELGIDCGGACPQCDINLKRAADFPGGNREGMIGFSINDKAYVGFGKPENQSFGLSKELWRYDPIDDQWTQLNDYPLSSSIGGGIGVEIDGKGYVANAFNHSLGVFSRTLKRYDPVTDSWENYTQYPNLFVSSIVAGFELDAKMYLLNTHQQFISYDPITQEFEFLEEFPGEIGNGIFYFEIDDVGYVGQVNDSRSNFFAFSPITKKWQERQTLEIFAYRPYSFAQNSKGYVGGGWGGGDQLDQFWEYDPSQDKWQRSRIALENLKIKTKGLSFYSSNYVFFGLSDNLGDPSTSFFVLE